LLLTACTHPPPAAAPQYTLTPDYYKGGARSQLRRYCFDLTNKALVSDSRLLRNAAEFPSVAPGVNAAAHRHVYCCADIVDDDVYWGPAQARLLFCLFGCLFTWSGWLVLHAVVVDVKVGGLASLQPAGRHRGLR
jgi:hypothetical protein